jgi:hypothetical protein
MLKKVLLALGAVIVIFLIVVALQPANFRVTRTTTMAAPAAAVFAQVNDLRKWEARSPWAKLDPNARNSFEGPPAGAGAVFAWAGNNQIGEGKMTITESRPNEQVRFLLEFVKPMAGTSEAEFTFKEQGKETTVTWTMTGKKQFPRQGGLPLHEHGQNDGRGVREGIGSDQSDRRGRAQAVAGRRSFTHSPNHQTTGKP